MLVAQGMLFCAKREEDLEKLIFEMKILKKDLINIVST